MSRGERRVHPGKVASLSQSTYYIKYICNKKKFPRTKKKQNFSFKIESGSKTTTEILEYTLEYSLAELKIKSG